jgi:broad specificity phosphatase PhoE
VHVHVVTHPEVRVDPDVPVPDWGLSEAGRDRLRALVGLPWVPRLTRIVSSGERKAQETAAALAGVTGLSVEVDPELGENDRSATGFVPPAEFEVLADRFFARPEESVRGWERAVDAQARIVAAVGRAVAGARGDVAVVCHGGVGTLLLCHVLGVPIDRRWDQPGQGSVFSYDPATGRGAGPWSRLGSGGRPAPVTVCSVTSWEYASVITANDAESQRAGVSVKLPGGQPERQQGDTSSVLNRLGAEGWELVSYHSSGAGTWGFEQFWLKRPVE